MNIIVLKVPVSLIFILFILLNSTVQVENTNNNLEKIDADLLNVLQNEDHARYFIKLKGTAKISDIDKSLTKEEKGKAVYELVQENALKSQATVIAYLESEAIQYHALKIVNAIIVETNFEIAQNITSIENVDKLIFDPSIDQELPVPDAQIAHARGASEPEWGLQNIFADQVWQLGIEGEGIVVGGADTGFEWVHPTIKNQYRGNLADTVIHDYNWHDAIHELNPLNGDTSNNASNNPCGLDVAYPCDDNNHGTHTMGTMVGKDSMFQIGVAPKAKWIACRNMERGWGAPSTYLECFEWFLAPTDLNGENPNPSAAPDVINNSWRCPPKEGCNPDNIGLLQEAIQVLKSAGIFVVVSAGNEGPGCGSVNSPPAIFDESFSVGAYQFNDSIAYFSGRGPVFGGISEIIKPDIAAPGVDVLSGIRNGGFAYLSGTSMASPHVAGAVALILSANPELRGQPDIIAQLLTDNARKIPTSQDCGNINGSTVPNNTFGHGSLNVLAAVQEAIKLSVNTKEIDRAGQIQISPNPSNSLIKWEIPDAQIVSFHLFTLSGQSVYSGKVLNKTEGEVDVSNLQNGIYILRLQSQDQFYVGKVVVAR
jgi:subtilisin family serine protease